MIATMCTWHEHHSQVAEEIELRFDRGEELFVAAPALIETYAVLTRLPPPYRLSPADTWTLLEANFITATRIVALAGRAYRTLLRRAPHEGIVGGRIYDTVIATCAMKAKVAVLLTFNETHFLPFTAWGLEIVIPGRPKA
jgi:predicted nucleic acid-binding protein